MLKTIIVAKSQNNTIGKNGTMPWHLPADLHFFKNKTMGHFVLMGRITYEHLKVEIKGRKIIVLTHNKDYQYSNCIISNNLLEGFRVAESNGENELFIAGGESIYKQTIDMADKMYITEIYEYFNGDTFFPKINRNKWNIKKIKEYKQDNHPYSFSIFEYNRK